MNNYKWIVTTACIFFLFSCKEKWQSTLEKVDKSLLYHNDYQGWELVQEDRGKWDTNYTIKKTDHDTVKTLFFLAIKKDGSINVNEYRKKYPCNDMDTCYLRMMSQDTLYFYKQRNGLKTFEVGEYAYRFTFMRMDSSEVDYYLDHEDSLRGIKGNNLPKLPERK